MGRIPTTQLVEHVRSASENRTELAQRISRGGGNIRLAHEWIKKLIALVFLTAATLKLQYLFTEQNSEFLLMWNRDLMYAVAAGEWLLSAWLFSGIARLWAGRAIILTLGMFAIISAREWFSGSADCGCFGRVSLHPAVSTIFDIGALVSVVILGVNSSSVGMHNRSSPQAIVRSSLIKAIFALLLCTTFSICLLIFDARHFLEVLAWMVPSAGIAYWCWHTSGDRLGESEKNWTTNQFLKGSVLAILLVVTIIGLILFWADYRTGSIGGGIAYLAGNDVYVSPKKLTVSGQNGESRTLQISNLSEQKLRILGYNTQCSCVKISNLPIELGPLETKQLVVHAESQSSRVVPVSFLTDGVDQDFPVILVTVVGKH